MVPFRPGGRLAELASAAVQPQPGFNLSITSGSSPVFLNVKLLWTFEPAATFPKFMISLSREIAGWANSGDGERKKDKRDILIVRTP